MRIWLLEEWCVSAFGNEVVRFAVGGESLMATLFVAFQAIDGNGYAVVQLAILWAAMVAVSVLSVSCWSNHWHLRSHRNRLRSRRPVTGDVPLIERAMVDTMLVTIDVMQLVKIYGHLDPRFVLWSCRLCEYATAFPGEAATLRSIGQHMTKEHGVRLVTPA